MYLQFLVEKLNDDEPTSVAFVEVSFSEVQH
jgi:hypothetical protein